MLIQEIYEIAVFNQQSHLCTTNPEVAKYSFHDDKKIEDIEQRIKNSTECNNEEFFKKNKLLSLVEKECLNKSGCNFKGKINEMFN